MANVTLRRVESPRGTRYYMDGKRISQETYDYAQLTASHVDTFVHCRSGDKFISECFARNIGVIC